MTSSGYRFNEPADTRCHQGLHDVSSVWPEGNPPRVRRYFLTAYEEQQLHPDPYRPGGYRLATFGVWKSPSTIEDIPVTAAEIAAYGQAHQVNRTQARQAIRAAKRTALVALGRDVARRHGRANEAPERLALALGLIERVGRVSHQCRS